MTIRANIESVSTMIKKVKDHCMCARFEDDGATFRVIYPVGMVLDGVQASYSEIGKTVALERMLAAMERHWFESGVR